MKMTLRILLRSESILHALRQTQSWDNSSVHIPPSDMGTFEAAWFWIRNVNWNMFGMEETRHDTNYAKTAKVSN